MSSQKITHDRDFKGIWVPKEIWLNKELTTGEKLLLIEINSLDNDFGCTANNSYFASFFGIEESRISQIITQLCNKNYIKRILVDNHKRTLLVDKLKYNGIKQEAKNQALLGGLENDGGGLENDKHNNIYNIISNNISTTSEKEKLILQAYCKGTIDAMPNDKKIGCLSQLANVFDIQDFCIGKNMMPLEFNQEHIDENVNKAIFKEKYIQEAKVLLSYLKDLNIDDNNLYNAFYNAFLSLQQKRIQTQAPYLFGNFTGNEMQTFYNAVAKQINPTVKTDIKPEVKNSVEFEKLHQQVKDFKIVYQNKKNAFLKEEVKTIDKTEIEKLESDFHLENYNNFLDTVPSEKKSVIIESKLILNLENDVVYVYSHNYSYLKNICINLFKSYFANKEIKFLPKKDNLIAKSNLTQAQMVARLNLDTKIKDIDFDIVKWGVLYLKDVKRCNLYQFNLENTIYGWKEALLNFPAIDFISFCEKYLEKDFPKIENILNNT